LALPLMPAGLLPSLLLLPLQPTANIRNTDIITTIITDIAFLFMGSSCYLKRVEMRKPPATSTRSRVALAGTLAEFSPQLWTIEHTERNFSGSLWHTVRGYAAGVANRVGFR
jgi:hypothetical protein